MYLTAGLVIILACLGYATVEEWRVRREHHETDDTYWFSVVFRCIAVILAITCITAYVYGKQIEPAQVRSGKPKLVCIDDKCKLRHPPKWWEELP